MNDKLRSWYKVAAKDVISHCGWGAATDRSINKTVKHYPKERRSKLAKMSKALRNIYKRKGVMEKGPGRDYSHITPKWSRK